MNRDTKTALQLASLAEIFLQSMRTGEYKDPGFALDVRTMIDGIIDPHICEIREVAALERRRIELTCQILTMEGQLSIMHAAEESRARLNEILKQDDPMARQSREGMRFIDRQRRQTLSSFKRIAKALQSGQNGPR